MERRLIRFRGRVQGVGFRATARSVAEGFPVSGWVRNEADGTVLIEVQGPPAVLDACLAALRVQMGGYIAAEDCSHRPVIEGEPGFRIRR